ncbi:MAG: polyhydroxyalkanoate synthesis regulator DNA-binding domain-containing protein [Pelagibacteraceae bacterium]|jgi:polyhydroxyalkanoate synthesis repressor PhaR|tara:strand:- start:1817 stop:2332 length:516 start_codon:yes stop_codon:yes gene_type:complete
MIEIKKYSNRRLYNTETSSYITQEDVVSLIKQGKRFKIRDVETKKEITSSILTQIVLDRETIGNNLIPEEFLKQIILFYENDRSSEMFGFLNNVMNFADANKFFTSGFENIMKFNPFDFQNYFNNNAANKENVDKNKSPLDQKDKKINDLAAQIDELKSQINKINNKEKVN